MVLLLTRMKLQQYLPNLTPPSASATSCNTIWLEPDASWTSLVTRIIAAECHPPESFTMLSEEATALPCQPEQKESALACAWHVRWPFARGSCTADAPGNRKNRRKQWNRMEATCCKASCRRKFRSQTSDNMDR